jgi:hypothetical protein
MFPGRAETDFSPFDLLHAEGSPLMALFYARLFWPDFVELDGMVFLSEAVATDEARARVSAAVVREQDDLTAVERSFNLVEVPSLFGRRMGETTDEEDEVLAHILAAMWKCRLSSCFPGRAFEVRVVSPAESGGEVAVEFYQQRGLK